MFCILNGKKGGGSIITEWESEQPKAAKESRWLMLHSRRSAQLEFRKSLAFPGRENTNFPLGRTKSQRERERHRESLGQFHFPAFPCSWCNLAIPPPPIAVVGIATAKENGNTLNFRSLSLLPLGVWATLWTFQFPERWFQQNSHISLLSAFYSSSLLLAFNWSEL